ncbi:MAG: hypothetical protein CMG50_01515 [Candidatus Marinimicrobia bacterium]|nr:hypothetical protein [Candidatus Neomarinimicrobiota bacterium]
MFKQIIKITRFHNLILGSFAVLISGYLLEVPFSFSTIYCMSIVMIVMSLAYIMNDYIDIESDQINHTYRPLVQNKIKIKSVIVMISILLCLLFILFFKINFLALKFLLLFVLPFTFIYNIYFKNIPIVGNLITSVLLSSIFTFSELVLISTFHILSLPFFLCFVFNFLREMIKDMHDYSGDLHVNSKTAPIYFGKRMMNKFIIVYTALLMAVCLLPYFILQLDNIFLVLLIILIEIPLLYSVFLLIKFPNKKTYKYLSDLLKYLCLGGLLILMLTKNSNIYV